MKKLIQGIVEFRKNLTEESRTLFAKLALGQKPDVLFIACSDSRVVPNLFASTDPGDLFVLRNIGNIIPPASALEENSASAVIEFAISSLNVADIVICGHSECGAMQALANGIENLQSSPHLESWLKYGVEAVARVRNGLVINPGLSEHNQISQVNVLLQMEHIAGYPIVRERIEQGRVRLHGWWFDIKHAAVYCYEKPLNQFVLIDEKESKFILDRLSE